MPVLLSGRHDQLAAEDGAGDAVNHVDPAQATSWRQGYLTYKEAPLSVVISDLNRYFARPDIPRGQGCRGSPFLGRAEDRR